MLRGVNEDGNRLGAVREEGGADALALAAVALVADGGHREMDLRGVRLLRGSDRVETWLQLAKALHELLGGELGGGMGQQGINDLAAPDIGIQLGLPLGCGHGDEVSCGGILLRDRGQELLVLLGDHIVGGESLADRDRVAVWVGNLFVAAESEDAEQLLHQRGFVGREHPERITHLVHEAGTGQVDLEVTGILGGALLGELAVGLELRGKGILAGIESGGIGGHRFRIKGWSLGSSQQATSGPKRTKRIWNS